MMVMSGSRMKTMTGTLEVKERRPLLHHPLGTTLLLYGNLKYPMGSLTRKHQEPVPFMAREVGEACGAQKRIIQGPRGSEFLPHAVDCERNEQLRWNSGVFSLIRLNQIEEGRGSGKGLIMRNPEHVAGESSVAAVDQPSRYMHDSDYIRTDDQ